MHFKKLANTTLSQAGMKRKLKAEDVQYIAGPDLSSRAQCIQVTDVTPPAECFGLEQGLDISPSSCDSKVPKLISQQLDSGRVLL